MLEACWGPAYGARPLRRLVENPPARVDGAGELVFEKAQAAEPAAA